MATIGDTKERILNSALDLIYARSYAEVGVQEVCEHAGVKKGSFYHFFPSKRDLTVAALEREWANARRATWEPAFTNNLSLRKKLDRWIDLFHQRQCDLKHKTGRVSGCLFGNLALELSTQDEAIRRKVDQIFRECTRYVERVLEEAIMAGEIPKQNVSTTAEAILAYIEGVMLMAKTRNDPTVIKKLRQGLLRLLQIEPAVTDKAHSDNGGKNGL